MGEQGTRLVWDPLQQRHVAIAPKRMARGEPSEQCPFCADLQTGRVPAGTQAWVRPNDFPALTPPAGECVVLVYSPQHERTFAEMGTDEVLRVLALWQQVYADLAARYPCVMTWETSGEAIGQTQRHPHGQAYGVAVLPDLLARELRAVEQAAQAGQGCPVCTLVRDERGGPRVVLETAHWLAVVPAFARYPYQVHVYPRQHQSTLTAFNAAGPELRELAELLPRVLRAYAVVYQAPMPYMLAVHQLADERYHLYLELLPVGRAPGKLKFAASAESAWGLWLNDALPEEKAAELRAALAEGGQR